MGWDILFFVAKWKQWTRPLCVLLYTWLYCCPIIYYIFFIRVDGWMIFLQGTWWSGLGYPSPSHAIYHYTSTSFGNSDNIESTSLQDQIQLYHDHDHHHLTTGEIPQRLLQRTQSKKTLDCVCVLLRTFTLLFFIGNNINYTVGRQLAGFFGFVWFGYNWRQEGRKGRKQEAKKIVREEISSSLPMLKFVCTWLVHTRNRSTSW